MRTRYLKLFVDLAQSLHFAHTAEANHMSPSTLSRIIQRMEEDLDCNLLERDNRSVELTEAGILFTRFCQQQIQDWQQLQLSLLQQNTTLSGKLRLYCSVTAAYSHLPPLLDRFRSIHPGVEMILSTGDPADAISQLQADQVDICIAALPDNLSDKIEFKPLEQVPMRLIAPTVECETRQLLQHDPINWQSLAYIFPEHGPAKSRFKHWLAEKGVKQPHIYARVAGHEALVSMVALGLGIGMAPQVVIDNSPMQGRLVVLPEGNNIPPFDLGLCSLKKHRQNPRIEAFMAISGDVTFD